MNEFENYRLDDAENANDKNTQTAKRVAAGVGAAALGGAAIYAATQMGGDEPTDEPTADDVISAIESGEVTDDHGSDIVTPEPQVQPVYVNQHVHVQTPPPPVEVADPVVEFNETVYYTDEEGNVIGAIEDGEVDGMNFRMVDYDGDGYVDAIGVDRNRNGIYEENEITEVEKHTVNIGNSENQRVENINDIISPDEPVFVEPYEPDEPVFIDGNDEPVFIDGTEEVVDYENNYLEPSVAPAAEGDFIEDEIELVDNFDTTPEVYSRGDDAIDYTAEVVDTPEPEHFSNSFVEPEYEEPVAYDAPEYVEPEPVYEEPMAYEAPNDFSADTTFDTGADLAMDDMSYDGSDIM